MASTTPDDASAAIWARKMHSLVEAVKSKPRPRFVLSFSLSGDVQRAQAMSNHVLYLRPVIGRFGRVVQCRAMIGIEQYPNPESRVYLTAKRDAVGVPRLVVDWRFTTADHAGFAAVQQGLADAFETAGLGRSAGSHSR